MMIGNNDCWYDVIMIVGTVVVNVAVGTMIGWCGCGKVTVGVVRVVSFWIWYE